MRRRRDEADAVNEKIQKEIDRLIEVGHPGAQAVDYNRPALRQWFTHKHPRGIELLEQYKDAMRRRHGWSGPDEPISPADEELDETGHLRPREGKDDITDMGGQTRANRALRLIAKERCIKNGEDPRDPRCFNERYVEVCEEDKVHSMLRGEKSLVQLHREELDGR